MMTDAALVLVAYLVGSIPMAYLVGRASRRIDIRQFGSGNAGASNVWVQVGKGIGLAVGVFDVLVKGSLPAYLAWEFGTGPWIAVAVGFAAVAGHNWSAYLGFTGGRGVTVVMGVMLVLAWQELLAAILVASGRVAHHSQFRAVGRRGSVDDCRRGAWPWAVLHTSRGFARDL